MIKKREYYSIALICIGIILVIVFLVLENHEKSYNHLFVIDDREEVIERNENLVPIKLEFYSEIWGKGTVSDSKIIQNIWYIIKIIQENQKVDIYSESVYENKSNEIEGNISYLNGKKDSFFLGNELRINNFSYGDYYSKPYIDKLRSYLEEILFSPQNLSELINGRNKVVVVNNNEVIKKCGDKDKNKLKNKIAKFTPIHSTKELQEAIKNKGKLQYHIKIYVDIGKGYNIINIDVYENEYIVVQDFGRDVIKAIYMKGHILDVCRAISSN
ncbi:DUF3919 family protein [Clostridium ganghwense]|uniref:DUF3919 family protein n=1 Tax=Clostridium ganghwense TaxID=312089 RepID=A0ABT4CJR6_9CLOT|nr:DUF3919 family protein [Clostridium ganghwense]MCY6369292.1 DUF3919 family protein [Clostridium ganghwense]